MLTLAIVFSLAGLPAVSEASQGNSYANEEALTSKNVSGRQAVTKEVAVSENLLGTISMGESSNIIDEKMEITREEVPEIVGYLQTKRE